jgi:hypothetical protein
MKTLIITSLMLTNIVCASETTINRLKGTVTIDGRPLTKKSTLKDKGLLKTGEKSLIIFKINSWGTRIVLGPNSSMELDFSKEKFAEQVRFTNGVCRWISSKKKMMHKGHDHKNKGEMGLVTKAASFGVRGTDFLVVNTPLLGETEIIMFDGKVNFKSNLSKNDEKELGPNQWGGIGGRFGTTIGKILTLPKNIIDAFKSKLPEK